jgi:molecular chaperone DnaK (HSP70)
METRHVRLGYEETLSSKKHLLSSQINVLHIIKRMKNYKILRKKETAKRNNLKSEISSLKNKINQIYITFPKEEKSSKKQKINLRSSIKKDSIQEELDEIKRKLEKLNSK